MKSINCSILLAYALASLLIQAEPLIDEHALQEQNSYYASPNLDASHTHSATSNKVDGTKKQAARNNHGGRGNRGANKNAGFRQNKISAQAGLRNRDQTRGRKVGQDRRHTGRELLREGRHNRLERGVHGHFRSRGGRAWWANYRSRIFRADYSWPSVPIFDAFFTDELAVLPTLGISQDILSQLIDEIKTVQAELREQSQSNEINDETRRRLADLIDRLLQYDPNFDVEQLLGNTEQA